MENPRTRTDYLDMAAQARSEAIRALDLQTRQAYIAVAQQWEMLAQRIADSADKGDA